MAAAELWVAGQRAMPSWARGRMNATVIMVSQGAVALGGVIWGSIASMWGVIPALLGAATLLLLSLILLFWLSIDFTGKLDFEPAPVSGAYHKFIHMPQPHELAGCGPHRFRSRPVGRERVPRNFAGSSLDSSGEWRIQLAPA